MKARTGGPTTSTAAVGLVEAKKEGETLTGVEWQSAKYVDGLPDALEPAIDAFRSAIERAQRRSGWLRRAVLERTFRAKHATPAATRSRRGKHM